MESATAHRAHPADDLARRSPRANRAPSPAAPTVHVRSPSAQISPISRVVGTTRVRLSPRCSHAHLGVGGHRASNGEESPACSRCPRMHSMITGSVIRAITRISTMQRGHSSGSTSRILFTSRLHADRRFASGEPFGPGDTGSAGTGSADAPNASAPTAAPFAALAVARRRWLEALQYLTRCRFASGTCVTTACTKSSGSSSSDIEPDFGSGLVVNSTRPSSRSLTAPAASAGLVT